MAALLGIASLLASSTILTFDQTRLSGVVVPTGAGGDIEADYGDRVGGPVQNVPDGGAIAILIDYSDLPGTQQDNIGIDNIRFGQFPQPPRPGTHECIAARRRRLPAHDGEAPLPRTCTIDSVDTAINPCGCAVSSALTVPDPA